MGTCRKIFLGTVTGILAFAFISAGAIKITPKISSELHKKISEDFVVFAKLHPAVHYGYTIDPTKFMFQTGAIEVVAGIFLVIGPRIARMLSCLILSSIMIGALYFLNAANKPREEMIVPAFFLFLSFIKLNSFFSPTTITVSSKKTEKRKETKKSQ